MPLLSRALGRAFAERSGRSPATVVPPPADSPLRDLHSFPSLSARTGDLESGWSDRLRTAVIVTSVAESFQTTSTQEEECVESSRQAQFAAAEESSRVTSPPGAGRPTVAEPELANEDTSTISDTATAEGGPPGPPTVSAALESRGWVPELREPLDGCERQPTWAWPAICQQLLAVTGQGFAQLAEELSDVCTSRGYRTIALAGNGSEVGTTSIVLTLAYVLINQPVCRPAACRHGEPLPPASATHPAAVADKLRVLSSRHILLVDADIRHPSLARRLGLVPTIGWEHVLAGQTDLGGALMTLQPGRLSLLPSVSASWAGAPSLAGLNRAWQLVGEGRIDSRWQEGWPRLLEKLREQFDFVFIDSGSWETATALLFGTQGGPDAAISVTRCPPSPPSQLPPMGSTPVSPSPATHPTTVQSSNAGLGGATSPCDPELEICQRSGTIWLGRIETFTPPATTEQSATPDLDAVYSTPTDRKAVAG